MAVRRRDPQLEQLWRRRLARWRAGGQSVRDFCAAEGIPESAWYFWRRELQRRAAPRRSPAPAFVPVTVVPAAGIEVRCPSGHVVTVTNADRDTLRQLFAALTPEPPC